MEQVTTEQPIKQKRAKGRRSARKGATEIIRIDTEQKQSGRPTVFTPELGIEICARIAEGQSIRKICRDEKMPAASTIYLWLLDRNDPLKQVFSEQYEIARSIQAEQLFDEILEIADENSNDWITVEKQNGTSYEILNKEAVLRSRLRVDTRKWFLSKVLPKKYGEKLDLGLGGLTPRGNTIVFMDFSDANINSNNSTINQQSAPGDTEGQ